jgi:AraC-like DNA-binding protein
VVRPGRQLRPFVTGYDDFDMAGWPPGRHRGLPDGGLTMVLSVGAPLVIRRAGHADLTAAATVAGLRSAPFEIVHNGTQRGVQVELTPRGCRALLGRPAAELAQGVWPLEQVVGRRAGELTGRLAAARGPEDQAGVLDAVLAGWAADVGYPPAIDAFWRALTRSAGRAPVTSIAGQIGLSRRHLGQLVRAELGLTPKTAARVLRFAQARACLRTGRAASLAQAAAMCGYFDQAHMNAEWKQLGGCTPGAWVSEELPFLQDPDGCRGPG